MVVFLVSSWFIHLIETDHYLNGSGSSFRHEILDLLTEVPLFSHFFVTFH